MHSHSLWIDTAPPSSFPKLEKDLRVDVLIAGGGITGLTAAYLLSRAGRTVAVVERGRLGGGETGHTTAHLTYETDERLSELVHRFGRNHAQAAWHAGASAIAQIQAIVSETGISCGLRAAPGFLVAAEDVVEKERERLREEATLAAELGFDAQFIERAPVFERPAMRLGNQMKFHPLRYLRGLASEITRMGGRIFEETEVSEFGDDPRHALAGGHRITFDFAILATHVTLQGNTNTLSAALFQTKLAGYSTYAIEARVPSGVLPEAMWWDTGDPYLYLRADRTEDGDIVILGGEDHKTGQKTDTEVCYRNLEQKLRRLVPKSALIERRWSGQVIESVDGLPFIGEIGNGQFVAAGFAGNGMTFGTLSGMMACDAAMRRKNPWQDLFAVERKTLSATWDYVRENSDYPYYFTKGHLAGAEQGAPGDVPPGKGKVLKLQGRKVAVFRDESGETHLHSAVCPHLGCIVAWNEAERTWDCPCHGSRFSGHGDVLCGPAEQGLEEVKE